MSRAIITKQFTCKRSTFLDSHERPVLQAKLAQCLSKLRTVGQRKEVLGEDDRYIRSIIYHRTYANSLFGIFASYERGTHQLTVLDDDEAEMLTVEQVAPPKGSGDKRQEFLEGVCFFASYKNHLVIAPSRALGAKALEQHFNWLLMQSGAFAENNSVILADHISTKTKDRISRSHVKEVEIGTPLFSAQPEHQGPATEVENFEFSGIGISLLKQLLGDSLEKIKLTDAINGDIEVSLKIRYKRSLPAKAHKVLDNIAIAMRHLDEDDVKLRLADGGKIKGSELKISTPMSIQAVDGIPNPDDIFEKMKTWLFVLIENKTIDP